MSAGDGKLGVQRCSWASILSLAGLASSLETRMHIINLYNAALAADTTGEAIGTDPMTAAEGASAAAAEPRLMRPTVHAPAAQNMTRAHRPPRPPHWSEGYTPGRPATDTSNPSRHLWIGPVTGDLARAVLVATFEAAGEVESVAVFPGKTFAFVNFVELNSAVQARNMFWMRVIPGVSSEWGSTY